METFRKATMNGSATECMLIGKEVNEEDLWKGLRNHD
jgi:hypothetical protein